MVTVATDDEAAGGGAWGALWSLVVLFWWCEPLGCLESSVDDDTSGFRADPVPDRGGAGGCWVAALGRFVIEAWRVTALARAPSR